MTNDQYPNPRFDNSFIADLEFDPAFIRRMRDKMIDAVEDELQDFACGIASDYAPDCGSHEDEDAYDDALNEELEMPIYEKAFSAVLRSLRELD